MRSLLSTDGSVLLRFAHLCVDICFSSVETHDSSVWSCHESNVFSFGVAGKTLFERNGAECAFTGCRGLPEYRWADVF